MFLRTSIACLVLGGLALLTGCPKNPAKLETDGAKVSYAQGFGLADQMKQSGIDGFEQDALIQGVKDAFAGKKNQIPEAEIQKAFESFMKKADEARKEKGKANVAIGEKFLAENAKKDGVKVTQSGLQYKVVKAVEGAAKPKADDKVKVHYHGTLIDGTVFDSSVDRGEPVTFPLNQVIPGWTEGVQLMGVGEKFTFYIPSKLAYGERDAGKIPANSVLIFDVELLAIGDDAAKTEKTVQDKLKEAADAATDKAKDAAKATEDKVKQAADAVADTAKDATKATEDKVKQAANAVADTAKDAAKATEDKVKQAANAVADTAKDAAKATEEKATEAANAVADTAKDAVKAVEKKADEVTK